MAKFLDVNSDRCLILDPREALMMPFRFKDWDNLQLCFAVDWVNSNYESFSHPFSSPELTDETRVVNNAKDRFYVGLKSYNEKFPGVQDSSFIGLSTTEGYNSVYDNDGTGSPRNLEIEKLSKSAILSNSNIFQTDMEDLIYATYSSSFYYCFIFLEFKVLNKGKSNQQIQVAKYYTNLSGTRNDGNGTPDRTKIDDLRSTATFGGFDALDYNAAGLPISLPNSIFIYSPWVNKKMRIYTLALINLN